MNTTTENMTEQQNKAIGGQTTKLGGFTLNLPPVVHSSSIYELFYFNNGRLSTEQQNNLFQKSLLINRTKHIAWEESNNYSETIKQDKSNGVYFGFSNFGKIACNMGAQDTWKRTALAFETNNDWQDEFFIAPTYKISFNNSTNELTISIYNENINTQAQDSDGMYYLYSYEQYLQERFGSNTNGESNYKRNLNNKHCLTIPHAVSSKKIQNGKFLFNIGLLNAKPNNSCTITFENCDVDYAPEKLYKENIQYPSSINSTSTNTIFDVTSTTKDKLFQALASVDTEFKNQSFAGIFNDKHEYSKLQVKTKNTTTQSTVSLTYGSSLPAEINDLRVILDTLRRWFDKSNYKTGYVFPSFKIQK